MKNLQNLLLILILCAFTSYSQEQTSKESTDKNNTKLFTSISINKSPTKNLSEGFLFTKCLMDAQKIIKAETAKEAKRKCFGLTEKRKIVIFNKDEMQKRFDWARENFLKICVKNRAQAKANILNRNREDSEAVSAADVILSEMDCN